MPMTSTAVRLYHLVCCSEKSPHLTGPSHPATASGCSAAHVDCISVFVIRHRLNPDALVQKQRPAVTVPVGAVGAVTSASQRHIINYVGNYSSLCLPVSTVGGNKLHSPSLPS